MVHKSITETVITRRAQENDTPEDYMYTEVSFKDIIFIPFKEPVAYTFLLVNYLSLILYVYVLGYSTDQENYEFIILATESIYIIHTALLILHRLMKTHSRKRYYQPASIAVIIIDVLVIIPFGKIALLLQRFSWTHLNYLHHAYHVTYYVKLLRIVRIVIFFREYKSNLKLNRKIILPLIHFIISTLFAHVMAVAYYRYACYQCGIDNWSSRLENFDFNLNYTLHWALICYFCSYTLQLQNASALLINMTSAEYTIAAIILLVGFIVQFMFLTGSLISEYIQRMKFKFRFEHKVANVCTFMQAYGMSARLQKNVVKYYEEVWNRRKGLIEMPSCFKLFSPEFQMEIKTDIYWEAILHTHIFSLFDISFKKELSSIMTTEILLPGQDFYSNGRLRYKMVYLVSGILEVMTPENMKSPIMSLSSGTVLGETACIVPTVSSAIVRSATICEMHILEYQQLAKLMKKYTYLQKTLKRIWLRRIWFAKYKKENLPKSKNSMTHILWIKTQWRRLLKLGLGEHIDESQIYNNYHTSRFLDLLVLSTQDELKVDSICIKGSCSFVMDPNSGFRQLWDYISLVTIVLQVFATSHLIFHTIYISPGSHILISTLDVLYAVDVYIQAITAANVHGVLISKPSEVFLHRTKEFTFLVDVVAALPLDPIGLLFGAETYVVVLFRIVKFFKIYKIFLFIMAKQNLLSTKAITYQIVRFVSQHSIVLVMLVGLMYLSNCLNGICKKSGWLSYSESIEAVPIDSYLKTIYHTFSIYFSMNISDLYPMNIVDLVAHYIVYVIGYYMCAFSTVGLCAYFALNNEEGFLFNLTGEKLESMINERSELLPMKNTITQFTKHQFIETKSLTLEDVPTIMDQKSNYLKKIIRKEFLMKILQNIVLFRGCNYGILEKVANLIRVYSVPKDHTIVEPNCRYFHLHIIIKGYCKSRSYTPGDVERGLRWKYLSKFDSFPIIGVVHKVPVFIEVKTETACQIASISYPEMERIFQSNPSEYMILTKVLKEHSELHGNMITRKTLSYLSERKYVASQEGVNSFQYQVLQDSVGSNRKNSYMSIWREKYKKFKHFIIWETYDPNGKFVLCYETLRSLLMCMHIIQLQLSILPNFVECFANDCTRIHTVLQYFSFVDYYIRAHYQYYNSLGIKVSHPFRTCKHYFVTSFLVDLIGSFPINLLKLHKVVSPQHAQLCYIVFTLVTRIFLLVRPYMLMNYYQDKIPIKLTFLCKVLKITFYGFLTAGHFACFQVLISCPISEDLKYVCVQDSWLTRAAKLYSENNLLFISFYSIVTLTSVASFKMITNTDHIVRLMISACVFFFKLLYIAEIIGCQVFENVKLSNYQDGIYHYLRFIKKNVVSNSDTQELLEHYKNMWKKSKGEIPSIAFDYLYPLLKSRACSAMYAPTLMLSPIWSNADKSFLNLLSTYLEERHFKKGAEIIRCNDVQDMVFIVYKGFVDISLGGMVLNTLEAGGIFGCFEKTGSTRQTISVIARVHICVLCISTIKLYEIATLFPFVTHSLNHLQFEKQEFVPISPNRNSTITPSYSTLKYQVVPKTFLERTLDENNSYYVIWNYLASVHVAALSSILCLYLIFLGKDFMIPLWIALDVYYLVHMYLKTHARHTDLESGLTVSNFYQILKNYSKSYMIYVDLFSILPIYLIRYWIYFAHFRSGYFLTNKLLRILYLWNYYWQHVLKKNVPRHIRWTFLFYLNMFLIQLIFSLWWLLEYSLSQISFDSVSSTYLHVLNLYTNAGLYETRKESLLVLVINLIMLSVSHCLTIYLLIVVSRMLLVQNNHIAGYKLKTELLETHCRQMQASTNIIERAWNYLIYLYRRQKGEQIPTLLKVAPAYIKQDHMKTLFGRYFERHFIFINAHNDFLRQIYMHINLCIYLPDAVIVESGDVNGTLYFIHEGTVRSIEKSSGNKYFFENLSRGEWFGEVQGILNCPYDRTYRAVTVTSILSLCKSDWEYLLKWFPATEEMLYELARVSNDAR